MSNQSTKNSGMNDDGMLNAETQRKLPQGKISQPKLRFKGFTDPWQQRKLGELGFTYSGLSGKNKSDFGHGSAYFITYLNVFSNPIADCYGIEAVEIDDKQHKVITGDIFFTASSETPEDVGMTSLWLGAQDNLYLNSFCFGYRMTANHNSIFMAYSLRSPQFRSKIQLLAQGISRFNISKKKVMELISTFPSLSEQIRIGEFFRVLDDLIAAAKKKADLLKLKKRYYLQAIFSQQLRFKGFTGPWQQRKLGDLLKFERPDRYIEPDGDYLSKGATPVLTANKGFVLGYTNNPEGIYDKGPCVIFDDFTLDRKLVRCPFKVRSSAIKILTANPSVDLYFMFELLEFQKFPSLGHARHYISVVEPWRTPVPDYLEQTHIGEMFRVMDDLIVAVTRRIELLERQKTAYLQCLFV